MRVGAYLMSILRFKSMVQDWTGSIEGSREDELGRRALSGMEKRKLGMVE